MLSNLGEIFCPVAIKGRICNVSRLCRSSLLGNKNEKSVIVCPLVVQNLIPHIKKKKKCSLQEVVLSVKNQLSVLSYWNRCQCSPEISPTINVDELFLYLALVPNHRFIVVYVTNSKEKSVVIGTKSLLESVYKLLQLPQLKPCLQRPCEPSIGILNLDLARSKKEEPSSSKSPIEEEFIKLGSVLIFQQNRLLYIGRPLEDYGCSPKEFLKFISQKTKHDFHQTKTVRQSFGNELKM